jgi:ATP-dependent Clp protease protease subunit
MPQDNYNDIPNLSTQDAGIYVLMGDITEENVKPVIEWILIENHVQKTRKKELILMICSDGGSVVDGFALIDVMNASAVPIKTVGLGCIASCGLLIFLAGAQGRRVLTPNTSILSHQFSWGTSGKEHELFAVVKEYELTQERMLNHYRICTNLSDEDIRKHLLPPHDVYLSANEALELGLCDHVAEVHKRRGKK